MKIRPLPVEVISKLRSGVAISCVAQCVEELVLNSVDAGATCIAVRINLPFYKIQVVDNGEGISPEQLQLVGERYATSKCHSLEDISCCQTHGYRGEALASLRDMSTIVEIESRTCNSSYTFCKIFTCGKAGSVSKTLCHRPSIGTTVTVLDFMYNMPVRRKGISEVLDLEFCRQRLECIALIQPSVSISLRNDVTGEQILQTRKSSSTYITFTHLFGHDKASNLKEILFSQEKYKMEGYISTIGHISKQLQYLYVNKRLVLKTKLHKLINSILNKHFFTRQRASAVTLPNATLSSPSKSQERFSIFILKISCPHDIYDITLEPQKSLIEFQDWNDMLKFLEDGLLCFLEKNNLLQSPLKNNEVTSQKSTLTNSPDAKCRRQISAENTKNALFSQAAKRIPFHSVKKDNVMVLGHVDKPSEESQLASFSKNNYASQIPCSSQNATAYSTLKAEDNIKNFIHKDLTKLQSWDQQDSKLSESNASENYKNSDKISYSELTRLCRPISLRNVEVTNDYSGGSSLQILRQKQKDKPETKILRYSDSEEIDINGLRKNSINRILSDTDSEESDFQEIKEMKSSCSNTCGFVSDKSAMIQVPVMSSLSILAKKNRKKTKLAELRNNFKYQQIKKRTTRLRTSRTKDIFEQEQHSIKSMLNSKKITKVHCINNGECENIHMYDSRLEKREQLSDKIKLFENTFQGTSLISSKAKKVSTGNSLYSQKEDSEPSLQVQNLYEAINMSAINMLNHKDHSLHPENQKGGSVDFQGNILCNRIISTISGMNNDGATTEKENGQQFVSNSGTDLPENVQHTKDLLSIFEPFSMPKHISRHSVLELSASSCKVPINDMLTEEDSDVKGDDAHNHDRLPVSQAYSSTAESNVEQSAKEGCNLLSNKISTLSSNVEESFMTRLKKNLSSNSKESSLENKFEGVNKEFNPPLLRQFSLNKYPCSQGFIVTQTFDISDNSQRPSTLNDKRSCDIVSPLIGKSSSEDCSKISVPSIMVSKKTDSSVTDEEETKTENFSKKLYSMMKDKGLLSNKLEGLLCTIDPIRIPQCDEITSEVSFNKGCAENIEQILRKKNTFDKHTYLPVEIDENSGCMKTGKPDCNDLVEADISNKPFTSCHAQNIPFQTSHDLTFSGSASVKESTLYESALPVEKDFSQRKTNEMLNVRSSESKPCSSNSSPSLLKEYSLDSGKHSSIVHSKSLSSDSPVKETAKVHHEIDNQDGLESLGISSSSLYSNKGKEQIKDLFNGNNSAALDNIMSFSQETLFSEGDHQTLNGEGQRKSDSAEKKKNSVIFPSVLNDSSLKMHTCSNQINCVYSDNISKRTDTKCFSDEINLGSLNDFVPNCDSGELQSLHYSTEIRDRNSYTIMEDRDQIKDLQNKNNLERNTNLSLHSRFSETNFRTSYSYERRQTKRHKKDTGKTETNSIASSGSLNNYENINTSTSENSPHLSLGTLFSETSKDEEHQSNSSLDNGQSKNYEKGIERNTKTASVLTNDSFINIQQKLNKELVDNIKASDSKFTLQESSLDEVVPLNSQSVNFSVSSANMIEDAKQKSNCIMQEIKQKFCDMSETQNLKHQTDHTSQNTSSNESMHLVSERMPISSVSASLHESNKDQKKGNTDENCSLKMWIPKKNPLSGKTIYINAFSGNSSYSCPEDTQKCEIPDSNAQSNVLEETDTSVKSHFFLSHNASPFMPRPRSLRSIKQCGVITKSSSGSSKSTFAEHFQNHLEEQEATDIAKKWKGDVPECAASEKVTEMLKEWKNPVFQKDCIEEVASICANQNFKSAIQARNFMEPCCFSKNIFNRLEVIGQVDCKFLACLIRPEDKVNKDHNMIVLFDQHAVHERIRLEQLIDNLYEEKVPGERCIKTSIITPPLMLSLRSKEASLLKAFHNRLSKLGFELSLDPQHHEKVAVSSVPVCLLEREANEVKRYRQPTTEIVVENLLQEWLLLIRQTGGACTTLPKTLQNILNSQACRGAIKFGDALDDQECRQLLLLLSSCKLPFQCAHGRPSVVSLVNLDHMNSLQEKKPQPQLWKLSEGAAAMKNSANLCNVEKKSDFQN